MPRRPLAQPVTPLAEGTPVSASALLAGIAPRIADHEFVVFLGPSGCGKSTILRMIAGLESISGGEVSIAGRVVNDLELRDRGIAMVFQNYALYPHMTIRDNIAFGLCRLKISEAEIDRRIGEVVTMLGLQPVIARKPTELSGGQQQRVAIARAIVTNPSLLLADEPTGNLDTKSADDVFALLRRFNVEHGTTVLFVTHNVAMSERCDRIIEVVDGQVTRR